jgi:hypothetical protein
MKMRIKYITKNQKYPAYIFCFNYFNNLRKMNNGIQINLEISAIIVIQFIIYFYTYNLILLY